MRVRRAITAALIIILPASLTGCSSLKKIGKIGDTEFYSVGESNPFRPSFTSLVTKKPGPDGKPVVTIEKNWGSIGYFPAIFGAAMYATGKAAGAALYGTSLRFKKHEYRSSVNVSGGSGGGGTASSSSSSQSSAAARASSVSKSKSSSSSKSGGGGGGGGGGEGGPGGPKGNNGVGNGEDPPPPGGPPVNDGPGTGSGGPGNGGGPK